MYLVVFVGGALGTTARYGISSSMNTLPHPLSIRWGTFTANVIAAFALAAITAALSHTLLSEHAPASQKRAGELISKGLGMGVCGGLSTMSTLALEIAASDYGWSYAIVSLAAGIVSAILGALFGTWASGAKRAQRRAQQHQQQQTLRRSRVSARRRAHIQNKSQNKSVTHRVSRATQKASENSQRIRARKHRKH